MCRLFAIRAADPALVHQPLVVEANALRQQSREHPHGWGIAFYSEGEPQLARGIAAAHEDERFDEWSRAVSSPTVVAHVRKASVGPPTLENTHPFRHGPWVMAHNGTVPDFDSLRGDLEALIAPAFRQGLRGETDSERLFGLVLTALARRGDLAADDFAVEDAFDALEEAVHAVITVCAGRARRPSLNLVLTNGVLLAAFRHGRSLFFSTRRRLDPAQTGESLRHLIVSSEHIGSNEEWVEVPEDEFIGVDDQMRLARRSLLGAPDRGCEVA